MSLFNNNAKEQPHSGVLGAFSVDTIKWEPENDKEAAIIVHKHIYEDFPNGSYLIVGASQMAVFTNNLSAGDSLDESGAGQTQVTTFIGPCKIKLETGDSRFSPFRNISHTLTGGESAFHSTVYFINTTYMNELSWGTHAPIVVEDPEEGVNVHVRAFGLFGVHIDQTDTSSAVINARKFLNKVVGTRADYTRDELVSFMRAKVLEFVPDLLAKNIVDNGIGVLKISTHLSEFSQNIKEKLIEHFNEFGLTLDNFSFSNINVPDEDLAAINEMKIKKKRDRLEAEGTASKMDIESEARARMRAREGYTYQQEQSFKVMNAAAENEGVAATFAGAGMGLGMGIQVGSAIGTGMGAIVQNTMGNQQPLANSQVSSNNEQADNITCPDCGKSNPKSAKFCISCGRKFADGGLCPDCGATLVAGAKFCLNCGRKLQQVCPNCGTELISGAKFCPECGTSV
ncbi:MAG: SPFH domain-containing protein [Lachnospiraceae bacterium]|nr:SPFH domain-containing protein [Lachnospiraceae bacterium]